MDRTKITLRKEKKKKQRNRPKETKTQVIMAKANRPARLVKAGNAWLGAAAGHSTLDS